MKTSEELFEEARKLFPGGVNSPVRYYPPHPIYMKRGKGSKITDVEGREYLDYVLAYGPLILGHADQRVTAKVKEAAEGGSLFGAPTEDEIKLAKLISGASGIDMLRFVNSGTEATLHALRLASHVAKRSKILKMKAGYHGFNMFGRSLEEVEEVDFNSLDQVRDKLSTRNFSSVILEPVLGNKGVVPPEEGFLEGVREISEKYGTLMIVDEVITGFRSGFYPYYLKKDIRPDLATFGKIVGGGLPLAVFGGKEELMKRVRPQGDFPQAGTYSANPVSIAAGLATLEILSRIDYSPLEKMTGIAFNELSQSGLTVKSETGMLSLFFTKGPVRNGTDASSSDSGKYMQLFKACLRNGIYLPPSYDETIFLSFAHSETEVRESFAFIAEEAERIWKGL